MATYQELANATLLANELGEEVVNVVSVRGEGEGGGREGEKEGAREGGREGGRDRRKERVRVRRRESGRGP